MSGKTLKHFKEKEIFMGKKTAILCLLVALVFTTFASAGGRGESKAPDGKIVLTMMDLNPEGAPFVEALNKSFMEENPDIVIEYEAMASRQYDQRIQALAAAGDLPDIVTTQMFPQYKLMASNNLFMDLTNTSIVKSGIFDDIAATCLVQGDKVYGVTWNHLAVGAFYNKDMFAKHNLEIPTNWDEFLVVCETLKTNGITPIVSNLGDGWCTMYILNNAVGNLIYGENPDYDKQLLAGEKKLTDPVWHEIFEKIKDIYDKEYFGPSPMGGKYEQSLSDFANGRGAMTIIGTWVIPVFDQLNPSLNYGLFPVPFNHEGKETYITLEGELGMSIAANSENPEAALKYFEYFFSEEPYKQYLNGKKGFSAVKGINVSFHPSVEYIVDNLLSEGKTTPYFTRNWPAGMDALQFKVFQEVMMGTKSIPAALEELEKYLRDNL
jgi:raffinose/stachyose/melibiose transport system substrate-binding protein